VNENSPALTVSIHHVNFCDLSQQRIMHRAFTDMFLKTTANGNVQGFWWRRRVWQASLPWPKQPEFYTQRAGLQTPQGTSTRNAYQSKFFSSFSQHGGQLKHIMIRYQLPLTPQVTRRALQLNVCHLVTCSRLQYELSAPSTQLAAKWAGLAKQHHELQ
jgi:hypothetical protein